MNSGRNQPTIDSSQQENNKKGIVAGWPQSQVDRGLGNKVFATYLEGVTKWKVISVNVTE